MLQSKLKNPLTNDLYPQLKPRTKKSNDNILPKAYGEKIIGIKVSIYQSCNMKIRYDVHARAL